MANKRVLVQTDRVKIFDPAHDEYRFVEVDTDGDFYISDSCGDDAVQILIRRNVAPALIRALQRARTF